MTLPRPPMLRRLFKIVCPGMARLLLAVSR